MDFSPPRVLEFQLKMKERCRSHYSQFATCVHVCSSISCPDRSLATAGIHYNKWRPMLHTDLEEMEATFSVQSPKPKTVWRDELSLQRHALITSATGEAIFLPQQSHGCSRLGSPHGKLICQKHPQVSISVKVQKANVGVISSMPVSILFLFLPPALIPAVRFVPGNWQTRT